MQRAKRARGFVANEFNRWCAIAACKTSTGDCSSCCGSIIKKDGDTPHAQAWHWGSHHQRHARSPRPNPARTSPWVRGARGRLVACRCAMCVVCRVSVVQVQLRRRYGADVNQANASGGAAHMKNALTKNILPYSIMGGLELGGAVACVFVRCASCVVCR